MANRNVSFYGPSGPALGGGQIRRDYIEDPRRAMAQQFMQQGSSTAPVQSPLEGITRALTAGVGGYFGNQAREEMQGRETALNEDMMRVLAGGQQQPIPMPQGVQGPPAMSPGGYEGMQQALGVIDNPVLAPFAQQLSMQQIQQEQAAQAAELSRKQGLEDYETQLELKQKYASPAAVKTVKTAEGVFVLNPDGTLGNRLGGAKADTQITIGGELKKGYERTFDAEGNPTGARAIPGGSADPIVIEAAKKAEKDAALAGKREEAMPGIRSGIMTKSDRLPILKKNIEDIKELSEGFFTSGALGQVLSPSASSDQYLLNAKLETLKSAVGLQELIDVKAQGATFGSLTENEMSLLISAVGALDGNLPPDQLGPVLDDVVRLYEKGLNSSKANFAEIFPDADRPWEGQQNGSLEVNAPQMQIGGAPEDQAAIDWATANPGDPRAAQILQLHGGQ